MLGHWLYNFETEDKANLRWLDYRAKSAQAGAAIS